MTEIPVKDKIKFAVSLITDLKKNTRFPQLRHLIILTTLMQ